MFFNVCARVCAGRRLRWRVTSPGWMISSHPQISPSAWIVNLTRRTGLTSLCTEETSLGSTRSSPPVAHHKLIRFTRGMGTVFWILVYVSLSVTSCLCLRYKRKGTSSLGLNAQRQAVSWDDSETKKKQKGRESKKAADRYYSTACRQMLRSEPPVPVLPSDKSDAFRSTAFLPLGDVDKDNKESGTSF